MTTFLQIFSALLILASAQAGPVVGSNLDDTKKPFSKTQEPGGGNQYLDCYDYFGQSGQSIRLTDYAPSFSQLNFDNRISSCCFSGIWILYDRDNYNPDLTSAVFNGWGEKYCVDMDSNFDNRASSARFAGAPDGYKYDTINLYTGNYFMGAEQYYYDDAGHVNYDNLGRSAIITGCSPWTVYQYDNYQGIAKCLYPADTINCYPSFVLENDLGGLQNQISSVRRGCFSTDVIHGKTISSQDDKKGSLKQYAVFLA
ncbi:uncharacterized protein LOC131880393 [Tigriopus californicus]|uniref:uncharacterized protein LOC131880393 n=1 Tax=Tigriopus californicus TaxID=6832 RepID=UPI0027D9F5F9|nr:uncharacterized protein LOC131880393 [Tigriopus californicus]